MAAPKGNKYNEKWTEETAISFCEDVLDYVRNNEKCRSLEKACTELDGYVDLLTYFKNKFSEKDFRPIEIAKEIIKARLIEQGLDNEVNASMAKFVLTNNHGMSEKVEQKTDLTSGGQSFSLKDMVKFE